MSIPLPADQPPQGLTPDQMSAIVHARTRRRKIARAASVATFSGWTMAVFAVITLLTGFMSLTALALGVGLGVVAMIELRGAAGLRLMDRSAPRMLTLNQIGLAAMLITYGGWGLHQAMNGPGAYDAQIAAGGQMAEMLEPIDRLTRTVSIAFYGSLILGSFVMQGCSAIYYSTRRDHLDAFLHETPDWVTETLRAAA